MATRPPPGTPRPAAIDHHPDRIEDLPESVTATVSTLRQRLWDERGPRPRRARRND
ncbi:hypothetical protein [Streptomyces sp. NBC_00454]|uniref:hypothetical protein n=1 Tax=Streptomyces sp. NBC_00454 TaxID=2975747 RepID=UPI0030E2DCE3